MKIKDIEHNGITYASVYNTNEINDGLSFFTMTVHLSKLVHGNMKKEKY